MVSQQEQASAAKRSRAEHRSIAREFFARAGVPLVAVARDLTVVDANAAAGELMDLRPGDSALAGFWSVSATAVRRLVDAVRRGVDSAPVSARTVRDRLVEVHAFPLEDDRDGLVGMIMSDRSGVDEAQQRLREHEERFRSLFEWAPVAMREDDFTRVSEWLDGLRAAGVADFPTYLADHPGEVRRAIASVRTARVNQAMADLLGAPSTLAAVQGMNELEPSDDVIGAFEGLFQALWNGRGDYESDFVGIDFSGRPFECRLRVIVPQSARGYDSSRVVAILLDLTELRATTRRLERLVADKDRFIASVSHELRTPLAAVLGMSEELTTNWDQYEPPELRDLVGVIAGQSVELAALVEDLLVAANLETGKVAVNPEIVSLNRLAVEAWSDCKRSCSVLDDRCISGPETSALADPIRVRQIIRNLLTNAVRYGGPSISIRVGAEAHFLAERVRPFVEVIDDGDGVSIEHRASIFDPYFQAAEEGNVLGSLGLGLAVSRELARRMGGDLTYAYRNGHSVFRLELPAA